jgi:predicted ATPase/DNA-binding CsgD family transcriptional regulator
MPVFGGSTPGNETDLSAPFSAFVGRTSELAQALEHAETAPLLTISGTGGVGKTRFARELIARLRSSKGLATAMVDLSALHSPQQVPSHIATSLGIADQSTRAPVDQISAQLSDTPIVILLDNCEHVIDAVSEFADAVLTRCPGTRLVATSTIPLGARHETLFFLPPLQLPVGDTGAPLSESEALLVDRARRINPGFRIDDANRQDVVALCTRLDGLPLAIEIAASKLRALSPRQVLDRLDARLRLAPAARAASQARHATVHDMVEWSFERCTEAERSVWIRLSIFSGWFGLEAAEEVCAFGSIEDDDVIEHLDALIGKSVLVVDHTQGRARYRQLYSIREYGRRLLAGSDETAARSRYVAHFASRARSAVEAWYGPEQAEQLRATRMDFAEFNSILASLTADSVTLGEAAVLATNLRYLWIAGGMLSVGRRWLDRILAQADDEDARFREALWVRAWVALLQGDENVAAQDIRALRALPDSSRRLKARVDFCAGLQGLFAGRLADGIRAYRQAIDVFIEDGDNALVGTALFQMAVAQCYLEDYAGARSTCTRVVALSNAARERWNLAYVLWVSSLCAWHEHDLDAARKFAARSLQHQHDFSDGICIALTLHVLSWVALDTDDRDSAALLARSAVEVWDAIGTDVTAFGPHLSAEAAAASGRLGLSGISDARSTSPVDQKSAAVETGLRYALASPRATMRIESLTERESQVAWAISRGLSNKEIAAELHVSHRTVEGHVEHILAKLQCTSRSQVVARVLGAQTLTV